MNGSKISTITIDAKSIRAANAGQLDLTSVYEDLGLPSESADYISTEVDGHGFVLSPSFQPTDFLLTVTLDDSGPLKSLSVDERVEALQRLISCSTRIAIGKARSIQPNWRPYHAGNLLAFQADRFNRRAAGDRSSSGRIVLEINKAAGFHIFAFLLDTSGTIQLERVFAPKNVLAEVVEALPVALSRMATVNVDQDSGTYNLEVVHTGGVSRSRTADGWYSQLFTADQRRFVDHSMIDGVRLTGPAGTGKTRALAVKATRFIEAEENAQKRVLILTHATQTAEDLERMILEMSPDAGLSAMAETPARLVSTTLYSLANQVMNYRLDELTPVSLDGQGGKRFQADVLNEVIERYRTAEWLAYRSGCSPPFRAYMDADRTSAERKFFLWDLLNEFACVIDAEGTRSSKGRRKQYLAEKRKSGMMPLQTLEERSVVLNLYDAFGRDLREMRALGSDQMITDLLNYVDTYQWDARRSKDGFDVIMVDELHLFNRQERMAFHHLSRTSGESASVAFAYDPKQSPRDTFLQLPSMEAKGLDLWKDANLPKGERIQLVDVFRYTPQIAKALKKIDDAIPGQNLDDDWPPYSGVASTGDGPLPTVTELPSVASYGAVLRRAKQFQHNLGSKGRVAVLFINADTYKHYSEREDLKDFFVAISSRDDASVHVRSTKRFILSMPEYVAGLQFNTVFLLDIDQAETPEGPYSAARLRSFVAQTYLGASRAEQRLEIFAAKENGGASSILSKAVLSGAIVNQELSGFTVD